MINLFSKNLNKRISLLEKKLLELELYSVKSFWNVLDSIYDISLKTRYLKCIVCANEMKEEDFESIVDQCIFGGGKLKRYICQQCNCIFGPQKFLDLSEDFVLQDYRILYSNYSESNSTENEIKTFFSLKPKKDKIYLNWGCGGKWNETIERLRLEGFNIWGYEPSIDSSEGFVVKNRKEISAKFDGIFSNNVIEHFRDPVEQFLDFHSILKPDGVMAHSSPCYEYNYSYTRFHTIFLLGRSPHILAERTGFRIKDHSKENEYINYVFEKSNPQT